MSNEREFRHLKDLEKAQNKPQESNMSSDSKQHWEQKLVGKKITGDSGSDSASAFAKRDLPPKHRVIPPGTMVTRDFQEDRLNVHVGEDGVCSHVTMG